MDKQLFQSEIEKNKSRGFVIGCLGWFLVGNLVFFLELFYFSASDWTTFGVPAVTVVAMAILFFMKRNRIAYGIIASVIANTLLWSTMWGQANASFLVLLMAGISYPLPLGIIALGQ